MCSPALARKPRSVRAVCDDVNKYAVRTLSERGLRRGRSLACPTGVNDALCEGMTRLDEAEKSGGIGGCVRGHTATRESQRRNSLALRCMSSRNVPRIFSLTTYRACTVSATENSRGDGIYHNVAEDPSR
jgi:hypothetical protein